MLSVIIPTLNESQTLPVTIPHVLSSANGAKFEIIVSDCNSSDGTADVARNAGAVVVEGSTNRAVAMNRGAAVSCGEVLLFLHADSLVPPDFVRVIERRLIDREIVGGAFDLQFHRRPKPPRYNRYCLRLVMVLNRIRFRWTRNFYGDQGMFVRREVFQQLGGFPEVRLMEDIRFARAMNRVGRTAILRPPISTSPRRFLTRGVLRQFAHDFLLLSLETLGAQPDALWSNYNRWNRSNGAATAANSATSRSS